MSVRVLEPAPVDRDYAALRAALMRAPLTGRSRAMAASALDALAKAEARVHDAPLQSVCFHEVGAADTLVDLLGIALGLERLGIDELVASPVAVGSGTVVTSHGELAVPTPATAILLQDVPIVSGPCSGELTTPTGAAALDAFVSRFGPIEPMVVRRVGTGCGTYDLDVPDVCQLLVGEPLETSGEDDVAVLLESNIDHLTPEELAAAAERLRTAGALDVWQTPIAMKKGRVGIVLSALADPADAPRLVDLFMFATGTLGVRTLFCRRRVARRHTSEVGTSLGRARFKVATLPDGRRQLAVENDDAVRIAAQHGLPVHAAARILESEASQLLGIPPRRQPPSDSATNPSS